MIDLSWTIEDDGGDPAESPRPLLSTWHYLRSALRRRWRAVVALGLLGLLLGGGSVVLMPPGSTAAVTVLLAHPANMDGPDRGAMDLSLLGTRELADRTVRALGLPITPEAFMATVTAEPVTPDIVTIKVTGPDDAAATRGARELVAQYLDFRGAQLTSLSSGLRSEYTTRINAAQQQVAALTTQFEQLNAQGGQGASQAFDVLARRSDLNKKISDWQATIDDATLQTDAALQSTHVIDPVHVDRSSVKRAIVLASASGLIAGTALGAGLVVFRALVSERLRRRKDVGIALGTSVRFSVRSKGPSRGARAGLGRAKWARASGAAGRTRAAGWRGTDLQTLVQGLESSLQAPADAADGLVHTLRPVSRTATNGESQEAGISSVPARSGPARAVALAAVGNPRAAADVLAAAAARMAAQGLNVFLVDLSSVGPLAAAAGRCGCQVQRPTSTPGLAQGPRGAGPKTVVDLPGDWEVAWKAADVAFALVEVDPGIEVAHLTTWVDQVVPLVSAAAATAELLSTTGDLIRGAGLGLPFAMMIGCDVTDESLGLVAPVDAEAAVESVR